MMPRLAFWRRQSISTLARAAQACRNVTTRYRGRWRGSSLRGSEVRRETDARSAIPTGQKGTTRHRVRQLCQMESRLDRDRDRGGEGTSGGSQAELVLAAFEAFQPCVDLPHARDRK